MVFIVCIFVVSHRKKMIFLFYFPLLSFSGPHWRTCSRHHV